MYVKILEQIKEDEYDFHAPHPLQSYAWGEARKALGVPVVRFGFYNGEHLTAVYQMTLHTIPYTKHRIGYIPRSKMPHEIAVEFIQKYARDNNIVFVKWEPLEEKPYEGKIPKGLTKSAHPMFASWTQMVDLVRDEKTILAECDSVTRYNIGFARRKGVTVREMSNDEGFAIFSKLFFETAKRQGYAGHTPKYHEAIWKTLSVRGSARIMIAYLGEEPLAAFELFYWNGMLYYPYSGSSLSHRNVKAVNLLMWESIMLGKSLDAKRFDLWGSLPPDHDPKDPWAGFTAFKKGFGTSFVEYIGTYDQVIDPRWYALFGILKSAQNVLMKIRQKLTF